MRLLAIAAMAGLTAACGTKATSTGIAKPELKTYPGDMQQKAADELEALPPPCPVSGPYAGCSVLRVFIEDFGELRSRIRASNSRN
ncbi:hypothetical protein [Fodinicurvata sediminis]|uniref:hypothetical protein n=1 Tax=Fodinicurvata sediminis TaxID=1121832 RepID=UPI00138AD192|nr:hypothetical protein [Fodinicurvata sediminis]